MFGDSGKTLRDFLEALPREWISEDLMEALINRGLHLSRTMWEEIQAYSSVLKLLQLKLVSATKIILFSNVFRFEVGDWVKFRRSITTPTYGWQGAKHKSVGFVQNVPDKDNLIVSFCSGEARVLANEVTKVIPLDRGQHVMLKPDVKEPRFDLAQLLIYSFWVNLVNGLGWYCIFLMLGLEIICLVTISNFLD